jgi:hypothetical protein
MILAPTLSLSAGSGAAVVRPTFSRDFAGEKTLNNGTGPAIAFTRASDATYFDANGVLQTATSDTPRFDHDPADGSSKGLLIEEARTNSIRNAQGGGAVVGTPGTVPTHWDSLEGAGITREIVATETLSGFSYVDVKYSGTNSTGGTIQFALNLESFAQIVAATGQVWTQSAYLALVEGSVTGLTSLGLDIVERTAAGTFITSSGTSLLSGLTGDLKRISATRTLTEATTARISSRIVSNIADGNSIDITLRIAAPQLEQGAFPTSYIPTTSAAVTRSADSAVVTPISSFYNQSEGTLFVESFVASLGQDFPTLLNVHNGTDDTDAVTGFINKSSGNIEYGTTGFSYGAASAAGTNKSAVALSATSARMAVNGTLSSVDDTSVTMTADKSAIRLGAKRNGSETLNGHIRKIAYYPRRLSNALLQSLTAA